MMKELYTTSEVAKLCFVTPKTVVNWIEANKLPSMKTAGGFRKVFKNDLVQFMKKNNIPHADFKEVKIKLLIIDDDPDYADFIKEMLNEESTIFEFETAYGGEEGIFKIGVVKPDIVLMDVRMPKLDGFKVYDLIKSTPSTQNIQVIFMTGFNDDYITCEFEKRNITVFIKKPVEKEELMAQVSILFEKVK